MTSETTRYRRVLGRVRGVPGGPTLVALTGIHGNEASGVEAALRVLAELERRRPRLAGEVVFLAGNLAALSARARFIDLDLNRQWTPHKVAALGGGPGRVGEPAEHVEQRELLAALSDCIRSAEGAVHFVDLHTSSADGPPFVTIGDTLRNRAFAQRFPLPLILGLEEQVDGALLELLNNHGLVTMGVEAGRHDAPESIDRHEAVLWIALVASGVLREVDGPGLGPYRERLRQASRGVPSVIEVRYRHAIRPADRFRMEPGYANFCPVTRGEVLAHDTSGTVRAPEDGLLLLPLYQGLGEDGFFISREVLPVWLRVSVLLRRLRLNRLMRFLPGVRRDPRDPAVLIVDTRVARFYPLEIFHLCGFRKVRQAGVDLVVSRRRYDLEPPRRALPLDRRPARA
jgi:succinylglutamate desuccinylase